MSVNLSTKRLSEARRVTSPHGYAPRPALNRMLAAVIGWLLLANVSSGDVQRPYMRQAHAHIVHSSSVTQR